MNQNENKSFGQEIAEKDFKKKTVNALSKKGIVFLSITSVPGFDKAGNVDFTKSERAYEINDNGTSKLKSLLEVLAIVEGK